MYTLAVITILLRLFHRQGPNIILALSLGCFGILSHSALLAHQMFEANMVNFNLANVVSLVALIITLSTTLMAIRYRLHLILPVVFGFSALWLLIEFIFHPSAEIPLAADKMMIVSHISIALLAYAILIIATLFAFLVNYISYQLKNKKLLDLQHMPPLMRVEQQSFFLLALGTLLLLISEVSGFIFLDGFITKENAHKTILSVLALIIYGYTLHGHYSKGWRGQKVTWLTTIGTLCLTLSYFGSRFVKEFILS
jgi:ABC-type uncharacterized transport system permease subunit